MTTLLPPSPAPRRAELARRSRDLLWCAIRDHELELSPSLLEDQLRRELGVSRNAIREALDHLRDDHRVDRVQGLGTFARTSRVMHRCDRLHGFEASLAEGRRRVGYAVLRAEHLPTPPPLLCRALELDEGEGVVLLERLTLVDDQPASLRSHWLPGRHRDILGLDLELDFYSLVERELGLTVGEGRMVIEAIRADPSAAALLDVEVGGPLLLVQNTTRCADGQLLQVSFARTRSDRTALCSVSRRAHDTGPVAAP